MLCQSKMVSYHLTMSFFFPLRTLCFIFTNKTVFVDSNQKGPKEEKYNSQRRLISYQIVHHYLGLYQQLINYPVWQTMCVVVITKGA